jgi:hypothetical protein
LLSKPGRFPIALLLCLIAVWVTGCSGASKGATPPTTSAKTAKAYALLNDPAWKLKRAVDPTADSPTASIERPPIDWYDEYEHLSGRLAPGVAVVGQSVRISGYATNLARTEALLETLGVRFHAVEVTGWRAVRGSIPGDTPEALIVLDHGDSVIMALSYELTIDDLARLASRIKLVDRAAWIRAGGVVQ